VTRSSRRTALALLAGIALLAPAARGENVDQTVRVKTATVKVTSRPAEGQIDLVVGGTTYRYFIRLADPAALPAATAAKLHEIQASSLMQIDSIPYGDYRKVTNLTLVAGTPAETAAAEKALPKPYNGCSLKKALAKAVTAREAYDVAAAEAHAWQADSGLHEMQTLRDSPLDAQGRSTSWALQFYSSDGGAINSITVEKGAMRCSAHPSNRLKTFEVGPDVILDTARIYAAAQEAGGSAYTAEGYTVSAGLINNPVAGVSWYMNYEPPGEAGGGKTIIVNARTGVVR
jgi:hypothetical protein